MAEQQRVLIVDDEPTIRASLTLLLCDKGHDVVAEAASPDEAANVLGCFESINDEVDVVLVDGDLTPESIDGSDGMRVIDMLRAKGFGGAIVGISGGVEFSGIFANPGKDSAAILETLEAISAV